MDNFLNKVISILLCLLPLALVTGPFLPDLFLSIISLVFIFISVKNKMWDYYKHPFFKIFILFSVYILIRSIFSENIRLSLESSLFYFRFGFFVLAVWYLSKTNKKLILYFAFSLLATISVVLIDGYFQYFFGTNLLGMKQVSATHVSSFFGSELRLGSFLSRLFPLSFAMIAFLNFKSKIPIFLSMVIFVATDVLIYLSGERVAFLFLTMATFYIVLLISKYKKIRIISFAISCILVIGITFFNENVRERMVNVTINSIYAEDVPDSYREDSGPQEYEKKMHIFSPAHQSHYLTAFNMFKENIFFGQGTKMYRELCSKKIFFVNRFSCATHPHNTYMQLLAETGIIGFAFIFLAFSYLTYCTIRQLYSIFVKKSYYMSDYQICLLSCFLITLWPLAPHGNFFNNWLSVIYFLPIGFYLCSLEEKN